MKATHNAHIYDAPAPISDLTTFRAKLSGYLRHQLAAYEASPASGDKLAYDIAGLLSLAQMRDLGTDDPLYIVLEMAGQLELPEAHRSRDASWDQMRALVRAL